MEHSPTPLLVSSSASAPSHHHHHHAILSWEQWQHHSWAYCSSAGSPLQLLAQTETEHPWQELRLHKMSWLCSKCLPCGKSSAEVFYPLYWGSSNSWHRIQHTLSRLGLLQNCYQFVSSSQFNSSSSPQPVASASVTSAAANLDENSTFWEAPSLLDTPPE